MSLVSFDYLIHLAMASMPFNTRDAVSLVYLRNRSDPDRISRAGCGSAFVSADPLSATVRFRTRCPGPKSGVWDQRIQFMAWKEARLRDEKIAEKVWGEFMAEHRDLVFGSDVLVDCSCPDFTYMGYYSIGDRGGWTFPDVPSEAYRAPTMKNPEEKGALCKHLINVARAFI